MQTLLYSYSNQDSVVFANDKQQSMKLNAESRNRSTHMWSIDFQQFNREKLIFSTTNGAGKRAINVQINEP